MLSSGEKPIFLLSIRPKRRGRVVAESQMRLMVAQQKRREGFDESSEVSSVAAASS
jgi:hypothetical protein